MENNEYHPVVLGADTTDLQASGFSSISNAITQGLPAAAASGLLSIWNTFQPERDEVDTSRFLRDVDSSLGDYYDTHKEAVDMVGFVGTAFIPGTAGIKALRMARSGEAMGSVGRALGLAHTKKTQYLEAAMREIGTGAGAIPKLTSANRLKNIGWEVADQALEGAAFEAAVALTMNDSPIFDNSTAGDFAWNMTLGTALSGVIGGPLASIGARGLLKGVQGEVEAAKRLTDVAWDAKNIGLLPGTSTLLFAENLAKLPDEFVDLTVSYGYGSAKKSIVLTDSGAMLADTRKAAMKAGEQKLALEFNVLAGGNEVLGQTYLGLIKEGLVSARAAGKTADEQIQLIHGYLNSVKSIGPADLDKVAIDAKKFYATLEPTNALDLFSVKRVPGKTGKSAYQLTEAGQTAALKTQSLESTGFPTLKAAWRGGVTADMLILPSGRAAINPNSKNIARVFEDISQVSMWVDMRTGNVTPEAVIHFADTAVPGRVSSSLDEISSGNRSYKQAPSVKVDASKSAVGGSARWAWVSKFGAQSGGQTAKDLLRYTGGTIDGLDLPVLSRALELAKEVPELQLLDKFSVKFQGDTLTLNEFLAAGHTLQEAKYEALWDIFSKGNHYDLAHVAAHVNASEDFIEEAIKRQYAPLTAGEQGVADYVTAQALAPKTAQVTWDFRQVAKDSGLDPQELYKQNFGPAFSATQELSRFYNLEIRQSANRNMANAVLGKFAANFPDAPKNLSASVSQEGAGAKLLGASNAGYEDTSKLFVQETGKQVANTSQAMRDADMLTLTPAINALRSNPAATAELGVLTNALRKSKQRFSLDPDGGSRLVSQEVIKAAERESITIDEALKVFTDGGDNSHMFTVDNKEVIDFWAMHARLNDGRQAKFTSLHNAAGLSTAGRVPGTIYVPPVNTVKYPYHAYVATKKQLGVASDITMITAKDEASLRELIANIDQKLYDVHYKKDSEFYHKAKGDYDYQMTVHESMINSDLARQGKLADHFPETTTEGVLTDYLEFHSKQVDRLVRTAVQVKDRQFFGELQFLSDNYRKVSESTATGVTTLLRKKVADPFGDYIKTALNVSKQQEFPLLDSLNEFVDKVGLAVGRELSNASESAALKQDILDPISGTKMKPWEYADMVSERAGLGMPYKFAKGGPEAAYMEANKAFPRNVIRETFQKANMLLANFTLRLDFANSLINIISTSIMAGTELQSIRGMIAGDAVLTGALKELQTVAVPGNATLRVPSNTKLMANAIGNFFGSDKTNLLTRYKDIGAVKSVLSTYHDMLEDVALNSVLSPAKWTDKVNASVDKMAKYTGNNFSEEFTRFVTADIMKQLTDPILAAGKMTLKEQNSYINVFVNRVQGNYVTSQRPVIFQGTTGAAVSLFQTYAFNVLQQLHRHVEAKDVKTLAMFGGLQSTVFGFNGLPFFDAVNTHIIGSQIAGNSYHGDAYSVLPAFNKELGDWMLYGTASAFPLFSGNSPALYSRGDINPRHLTVIPVTPLDVPAVQASIKLVGTIADMGKNIVSGVDISDALLNGLEHQGVSRPLAGFAQLLAGRSTTGSGALISANSDLEITNRLAAIGERTLSIAGISRLAGARPMDEAVALNNIYRNKGYDALDKQRLESLGRVVKTSLRNGEAPSDSDLEDFSAKYAAAGGRQENFSGAMQRWQRDASTSVINQTAAKLNSNSNRRMQELMGGYIAPDFTNATATQQQTQP